MSVEITSQYLFADSRLASQEDWSVRRSHVSEDGVNALRPGPGRVQIGLTWGHIRAATYCGIQAPRRRQDRLNGTKKVIVRDRLSKKIRRATLHDRRNMRRCTGPG